MSSQKEINDVIRNIEEDYRHDLALHLYSTFLLHRINPLFPRRNWSSWPLPMGQVPDPKTSKLYCDSLIPDNLFTRTNGKENEDECQGELFSFTQDSPVFEKKDHHKMNKEMALSPFSQADALDEGSDESFDDCDVSNDEELNRENSKARHFRIRSVTTKETLTDSKIDLLIELSALIERKIHQRIVEKRDKGIQMAMLHQPDLIIETCKKLATSVDSTFNSIIKYQYRSKMKMTSDRPYVRLMNWQDILLAGLSMYNTDNSTFDVKEYASLYSLCELMFNYTDYNYQYLDYSEDEAEDDSLLAEESTINDHHNLTKSKLDVMQHLDRLERTHPNMINYAGLKQRTLKKWADDEHLQTMKKTLFFSRLKLLTKFRDLSWESQPHGIGYKPNASKKQKIRGNGIINQKETALNHGGKHLTVEDFTIDF